MVGQRIVGPPHRRDTYAEAWQAPTQWKSGISGTLRLFARSRTATTDQLPEASSNASMDDPTHYKPYRDFRDKPLPPLPIRSRLSDEDITAPNEKFRSSSPAKRFGSLLRRRSTRPRHLERTGDGREKSPWGKFRLPNLAKEEPESVAILEPGNGRESMATVQSTPQTSTPSSTNNQLKLMIDKGTQTSHTLLPFQDVEAGPDARGSGPRNVSFFGAGLPTPSRPFLDSPSRTTSPKTSIMLSPLTELSPSVKWAQTDYFNIRSRTEDADTASKSKSSASTVRGSILKNTHPMSAPKSSPMVDIPGFWESEGSSESLVSVGSYESRYDSRVRGGSVEKADFQLRPYISGAEPSLPSDDIPRQLVAGTESPQNLAIRSNESTRRNTPQPLQMPFTKFSSFSAARSRKKHGSSETRSSLLREELKLPDRQIQQELVVTPGFYHRPLTTPDPSAHMEFLVTEHLAGSPLCPASAKYKGKMDICPWHGRLETPSINGSSSISAGELTPFHSPPASLRRGSDGISEASAQSFTETRQEMFFGHSPDSPECPRNQGPRAVCVFHGEGRRAILSADSEDSVPRKRLIDF